MADAPCLIYAAVAGDLEKVVAAIGIATIEWLHRPGDCIQIVSVREKVIN